MNTDSYYEIGAKHVVCQDRSLHGIINPDCVYAVGADGCSDPKSPRTELGASLLCEIVRNQLELHDGGFSFGPFRKNVLEEMRRLASTLRLHEQTFDATLWLISTFQDVYSITGWGDAVIHKVYEDGYSNTQHIEFSSGMPRYLSYELNPARLAAYVEASKDEKVKIAYYGNGEPIKEVEFEAGDFFYHDNCMLEDDGRRLKSVTVFSDGACTYSQNDIQMELKDVVNELTAYKSFVGPFVSRRMLKLLTQHRKDGKRHSDDLFVCTLNV